VHANLVLQQTFNGIALGCLYALFALGLTLAWGVLKILNLAHAELVTFGAIAAWYLAEHTGLPLIAVVPAAAIFGGLLAVAMDFVAFAPLRRKPMAAHDRELSSMVTSLGASIILLSLAEKATNAELVRIPSEMLVVKRYEVLGTRITNVQILVVVTSLVLTFALWRIVARTQFGRALRSLAFSLEVTQIQGVNTNRITRAAFFACGALAATAGVLLALLLGGFDARFGSLLLLKAITIIVIAGSGEVIGALVGGIVLGLSETLGTLWLPLVARESIPFLLIIVVLMARPQGLFGRSAGLRV
jgi:branched-chain amino acid transport system permease protein